MKKIIFASLFIILTLTFSLYSQAHQHSDDCSHAASAKPEAHIHTDDCSHAAKSRDAEHKHSDDCEHAASAKPEAHAHTDGCSHAAKSREPKHKHSDDCDHAASAKPEAHAHTDDCSHAAKSREPKHKHSDDCDHAASAKPEAHAHTDDCSHAAESPDAKHKHSDDYDHAVSAKAEDHAHTDDCSHSDQDLSHESEIVFTEKQIANAGLVIAKAGPGSLAHEITLTGEVVVNNDFQTHHVSRTTGIADKINADIGDYVRRGDVLARIDSAELGQAKSEFYEIFNALGSSLVDLQRARTIVRNTSRLLEELKKSPPLETLQKLTLGDMGDNRARLLTSYAEYIIRKRTLEQHQQLLKDKVVSETDFLDAQSEFEKAQSAYLSAQDSIRYEMNQNLYEAERIQRVNEFKLRSAERRLLIFGLTTQDLQMIKEHGAEIQQVCSDDACTDSALHFHPIDDDNFSKIDIKAQRSGTVIHRNIELGEEVPDNRIVFTVADLSNLWAVLQAPARDVAIIRNDMLAEIKSVDGDLIQGRVLLVSPVVDQQTRTAQVRVALLNGANHWRPGTFVTGRVKIAEENLAVVVPRGAVQTIDGHEMVFVHTGHGFVAVEVVTGMQDREMIEIKSGLAAKTSYVSEGAFWLKAAVLTSNMDPCAGHNH